MIQNILLHAAVAFAISVAAWWAVQHRTKHSPGLLFGHGILLSVWALIIGFTVSGARLSRHISQYPDDTFFFLSVVGRVSLTLVSLVLIFILCALARLFGRWLCRQSQITTPIRIVLGFFITVIGFWIALTPVPQIHYTLYLILFDQLPLQWVLKPIEPTQFFRQITFRSTPTFASSLVGASFWAAIASAAIEWCRCHFVDSEVALAARKFALAVAFAVFCTNLLLQIG